MTRAAFKSIRVGDRVGWSGVKPEHGVVIHAGKFIYVKFDSGRQQTFSHHLAHWLYFVPGQIGEVRG